MNRRSTATGKATTFRLTNAAEEGLTIVSELTGRTRNQIANEAIREYVARQTDQIAGGLEATLEKIRAYKKRDPDFETAIAEFVEAEASADDDPAEGRVVGDSQLKKKSSPNG